LSSTEYIDKFISLAKQLF